MIFWQELVSAMLLPALLLVGLVIQKAWDRWRQ